MNLPLNLGIVALTLAVTLGWALLRIQRALHMLQLDSYANDRLLQWLITELRNRLIELPSGLCHVVFLAMVLLLPTTLVYATSLLMAWVVCEAGILLHT